MSRLARGPLNLLAATADPTTPTLRAGDMYYNSTHNVVRVYTGSVWIDTGPRQSRLSTAATSVSVTFAATSLSVPLLAGKAYKVRATGIYRSAAIATGIGIRLNGSGGLTATGLAIVATTWGASVSASTPLVAVSTALPAGQTTANTFAATTDYLWELEGVIRVNVAGNLVVELATEVAASTVTLQADCYLEATEIL